MLKKITLISIILFAIIAAGVFTLSIIYPNKQTAPVSPLANANQPLTLAEVAKHSSPSDCYLVINNSVYDVSGYIGSHPGGRSSITSRCGQEVGGLFATIHSNFAWNLLGNYLISAIGSPPTATTATPAPAPANLGSVNEDY
jgi:cytochrome b involved in lipid metabolism